MGLLELSIDEVRVRRAGRAEPLARVAGLSAVADPAVPNALAMLVKYIPTESVTLYIAAASALPAVQTFSPSISKELIYWSFGGLTPLLFFLLYFGVRRTSGEKPVVPPLPQWPFWRPFAATVAFLAWGLAVPGNPYIGTDPAKAVIAGLAAVFASTMLSTLARLFE